MCCMVLCSKEKEREITTMTNAIYFDMDGTIANLYGVDTWLDDILARDTRPYDNAKTMVRMSNLARLLNILQAKGTVIGVVSWLAKDSTTDYDERVTNAKRKWLATHLPSVEWNEIHIVEYGTPKHTVVDVPTGILFDDEKPNRDSWLGMAFDECQIMEVLRELNSL